MKEINTFRTELLALTLYTIYSTNTFIDIFISSLFVNGIRDSYAEFGLKQPGFHKMCT